MPSSEEAWTASDPSIHKRYRSLSGYSDLPCFRSRVLPSSSLRFAVARCRMAKAEAAEGEAVVGVVAVVAAVAAVSEIPMATERQQHMTLVRTRRSTVGPRSPADDTASPPSSALALPPPNAIELALLRIQREVNPTLVVVPGGYVMPMYVVADQLGFRAVVARSEAV